MESLVLAVLGGAAGVFVASAMLPVLKLIPANIPRLDQVTIDARVLLFSIFLTLLCGVLFGLAPAVRLSHKDIADSLRGAGRVGVRISPSRPALFPWPRLSPATTASSVPHFSSLCISSSFPPHR